MAIAQGARSRLSIAPEASFGVLPSTPAFVTLPYKSNSMTLSKERVTGGDILGDRMQSVDRHGNRNVGGSIDVDLRRGDYDLLLESAFFNTFDTNDHLTPGSSLQYFTLEDAALDISQFRQHQGCIVNSASFSIAPNQMVQTTFDIIGKNMLQAGTTLGAPTDSAGYEPFDSFNGDMLEGGIGTGDELCSVSQLNFSLNNNASPLFSLFCDASPGQAVAHQYGMATVEGTMTVYYEDETLINKFINETETSLSVTVDDPTGANGYTFYMPRVKYNGASVPVSNMEARLVELPFIALRDSTAGYNLRLTRTSGT